MIKIPISENQKQKIEKIYWDWINKYHLKNLLAIIEKDGVLKQLILSNEKDLEVALKKYCLADYSELFHIKSRIDEMRIRNKKISKKSEDFLKERYENYRNSQAAKVVNVLEISVCPYCNQNHINVVYEKGGKIRFWWNVYCV